MTANNGNNFVRFVPFPPYLSYTNYTYIPEWYQASHLVRKVRVKTPAITQAARSCFLNSCEEARPGSSIINFCHSGITLVATSMKFSLNSTYFTWNYKNLWSNGITVWTNWCTKCTAWLIFPPTFFLFIFYINGGRGYSHPRTSLEEALPETASWADGHKQLANLGKLGR